MSGLTQFFLNPAFIAPAAALVLVPLVIHLLSRLRYKRIQFAAMEFLLSSEELNRRRILLEQMLLLFLRTLAVLLIGLLIARLVLDPGRLLMLRGASVHHIVLLDDSLSMRDRDGESPVFQTALTTLDTMLTEGSRQSGSARVTILTFSDPTRPLASDRALDAALLAELRPRLQNLTCSWQSATPVAALTAARDLLSAASGAAAQVHVLTDFRQSDWNGQPEVMAALEALRAIPAKVELIRTTVDTRPNVVLESLDAASSSAARGVPWRVNLAIRNHGSVKLTGLRATVLVNGSTLPSRVLVPDLEPGARELVSHDLVFEEEGRQQVEVRLDEDALREDNRRFLAVDVSERRLVLVIDDEGQQADAGYVAAALSADPALTGLQADVRPSQALASTRLDAYDCIYLLNVRELPADVTLALGEYVRSGGGLIWFPGDQADLRWYSETLRSPQAKLFPVPIGTVQQATSPAAELAAPESPARDSELPGPVFESHPIFLAYNAPDSPFAAAVRISRWLSVTSDWNPLDTERDDGVRTIARLTTGQPVAFEHSLGDGRVLTFLFGAGRRWSNWPIAPAAPGYVVTQLLIHQHLQRPADSIEQRELTGPLRMRWPAGRFTDVVEILLPEPGPDDEPLLETFARLQAPITDGNEFDITLPQADRPGVYRLRRFEPDGTGRETALALNVPTTESDLRVADSSGLEQSSMDHVRVSDAASAEALGGQIAGREVRWVLIGLLIVTLIGEQLLALRLSYHPETVT